MWVRVYIAEGALAGGNAHLEYHFQERICEVYCLIKTWLLWALCASQHFTPLTYSRRDIGSLYSFPLIVLLWHYY